MTSREIIRRVVRHNNPPRIGWDFHDPRWHDIMHVNAAKLVRPGTERFEKWGQYPELQARVPGFNGELSMDKYGNILGRLNGITKGECVRGVIMDDWADFEKYEFPTVSQDNVNELKAQNLKAQDKYVLTYLPGLFSVLRDTRRMENALMDMAAEPEQIEAFLERLLELQMAAIEAAAEAGCDGAMVSDDWGMQNAPFVRPSVFRELFQPAYAKIGEKCRSLDIDFHMHSCGWVAPLVDAWIEAGVRVFQFDQPEMTGVTYWAEKYAGKAAFYCPTDIQKVMPTGDRKTIETAAKHMADTFRKAGGSLIAKDYPTWWEIDIKDEWAAWARDTIVANSQI
ncbi:MAG: hypothetical protein LBD16_06330 [Oscillospiraceae bacterium]|jgi:hypothetical protein|nr:hypothetical protein [Oscillospiraceae bacterium]